MRVEELLRYFLCSALALALDTFTYALLLAIEVAYPVAAAAGFSAGLCLAYMLSVRYVFETRSFEDARSEFTVFAAIGVLGLLLTEALLWVLIGQWRVDPIAAKLLTAGAVFGCNFTLRKTILFTARKKPLAHEA